MTDPHWGPQSGARPQFVLRTRGLWTGSCRPHGSLQRQSAGLAYLPRVQEVRVTRDDHAVVVHGQVCLSGLREPEGKVLTGGSWWPPERTGREGGKNTGPDCRKPGLRSNTQLTSSTLNVTAHRSPNGEARPGIHDSSQKTGNFRQKKWTLSCPKGPISQIHW